MDKSTVKQQPGLYFLIAALSIVFVLSFLILRPFLYALILAVVFATVFYPVYQKITRYVGGCQGVAALLTVVMIVMLIFTPLFILGFQLFQEIYHMYASVVERGGISTVLTLAAYVRTQFQHYFPVSQNFLSNLDYYFNQGLPYIFQLSGSIFGNFAKIGASSFLFLIALYYLFRDGQKFRQVIISLSPLPNDEDELILRALKRAVDSVLKGTVLVALSQGFLTAVGFSVFGIDMIFFGGSLAAIAALIPGVGTSLVLIPAILFLFLKGKIICAIGLMIWGICAVGLIDNFLGPILIGRGTHLHPLVILLSVLGGIAFFGPLGFLFGPLTVSLLVTLLGVYSSIKKG